MEFEKNIELLKTIKRVDAPPFLYTRIEARLSTEVYKAPKQWKYAFACIAIFILSVNIFVFKSQLTNDNQNKIQQVANSMNLNSLNNFYND